jgi:uncharacterized membrane protein
MLASVYFCLHIAACGCLMLIVLRQSTLVKSAISLKELVQLLKWDTASSWAALLAVATGLLVWLTHYANPGDRLLETAFGLKMLAFVLAALVSIYPSLCLLRLKKGRLSPVMAVSPWAKRALWVELGLLLFACFANSSVIPLLSART